MIPLLCRMLGGHEFVERSASHTTEYAPGFWHHSTRYWRECVRCHTVRT